MNQVLNKPLTSEGLLRELRDLVSHVHASTADCLKALDIAYEIGLSEGRFLGTIAMGDHITDSSDKFLASMLDKFHANK